MSEQTAVNTELYVTEDLQEAIALHARLTVAGIESRIEYFRVGTHKTSDGETHQRNAHAAVYVEFPMDLERARAERERYFRDMGWA